MGVLCSKSAEEEILMNSF